MKKVKKRFKKKESGKKSFRKNLRILLFCLFFVYVVAFLGSLFTSTNANSNWYNSVKNSLTPPNWVFPVVWNSLFFLISLSLFYAWVSGSRQERKKTAVVFGINLSLNLLWSVLFFGLKMPNIAFFELILVWISIAAMMLITWKIEKKSAWLLAPYLLWLSFAGVLNFMIAFL